MKQLLIILIVLIRGGLSQLSPCPDVFQFKYDGLLKYGIITIPPPGRGITILTIEIGLRGSYKDKTNKLKLVKSLKESTRDAGMGRDIQYRYDFPQSTEWPTIRNISLNYRDICNGPIENVNTFMAQHKITNPAGVTELSFIPYRQPSARPIRTYPTPPPTRQSSNRIPPITRPQPIRTPAPRLEITRSSENSWVTSLPSAGTCGRTKKQESTHLIVGGDNVKEGEFPWLVALFHFTAPRSVNPVCGGSLISNSYVITAAHCTRHQKRVYLELGKHDMSNPHEPDYILRNSIKIIEHKEYVSGAHNDVALIKIEPVTFTEKIKPICMWTQGTRFDNILQDGTVTGWGKMINGGSLSTTPMKLEVRTVGLDVCRKADENLRIIATDKTFCAGGTGTGPCHGDSGSGFYMKHADVWYLRGVISTSLGDSVACNLNTYAVYVDLTYFLDWMRPYLLS